LAQDEWECGGKKAPEWGTS